MPGGFSFGDELGSGQLLALKIRAQLGDIFRDFTARKKPVIGICNGFQVLVRLGLLPFPDAPRAASLAVNSHGEFMNKWADLKTDSSSVCLWTKDMEDISLPVRHKEGRIVLTPGAEKDVYKMLVKNGQIPLRYAADINGSYERIAAICDPSGLILGMMPHPEAFVFQATGKQRHHNPLEKGAGLQLFENILRYLKGAESDREGLQRHG